MGRSHIPPIAERISLAQRIGQSTSATQRLAPCVVLVFYHKASVTVKDTNNVALQIVDISIDSTVVADLRRTALRIVEEVQLVLMRDFIEVGVVHRHMREQFTVVSIIGGFRVPRLLHDLLHAHTIMIVLERYARTLCVHLLELAAGLLQTVIFMIRVRRLTISIIIIEKQPCFYA